MNTKIQRANKNPNVESQLLATREKLKELVDMSKTINRIYHHSEERQINSWSFTHESIDIRSSSIICKYDGSINYKNSYTHTTKAVHDYAENIREGMTCSCSYPRCNKSCFKGEKINNLLEKSARLESGLNKATKYLKRQKEKHKELMKTLVHDIKDEDTSANYDEIQDYIKRKPTKTNSQESITIIGSSLYVNSNKKIDINEYCNHRERKYDKATVTDAKVFNKHNKKIEVNQNRAEINHLNKTKAKLQSTIDDCDKLRRKFRKAFKPNNQSQISIHDKLDTLMESLNTVISEVRDMKNVERDRRSKSCNSLRTIEELDDNTSKEFRDEQGSSIHNNKESIVNIQNKTSKQINSKIKSICINTDPLGIRALLRISTESIKRLFVFLIIFPIIQLFSYFRNKMFGCRCVCRSHNTLNSCKHSGQSVNSRGCIGRHDVRLKLFSCQHCGETFIRAYCCQLHQKSCAHKHGAQLEERPSLLFLK